MRLWVIDTNVVVSALRTASGTPARLLSRIPEGDFSVAYDVRILTEYRDVLGRPYLKFSPEIQASFLRALNPRDLIRAPSLNITLVDPDDLPFIEVAHATPDRTVVTGNRRHFSPAIKLGIKVLSPAAALEVLGIKA